MKLPFEFLKKLYIDLGQPGDNEFARKLHTYRQKLEAWNKSGERVREAFSLLCWARFLSGKSWAQFGKELDNEFLKKE